MSEREEKTVDNDEESKSSESESGSRSQSPSESESDEELSASEEESKKDGDDKGQKKIVNQPFDEAMDLSESEDSIQESPAKTVQEKQIKNQPFDEALELSGSVQDMDSPAKAVTSPIAQIKELVDQEPQGGELKNEPFDEQVDISDSEASIDTTGQLSPDRESMKSNHHASKPALESIPASHASPKAKESPQVGAKSFPQEDASESSSEEESGSDESEGEDGNESQDGQAASPEDEMPSPTGAASSNAMMMEKAGGYKESDYAGLKVSNDTRELFQYISRFKAQDIELETRLKCFIPEYIPAVGDIDTFLKVPRPDGEHDQLGLKMLDEPSVSQSDATVLDLQLRSMSKRKHGDLVVRSIENAEKHPKDVDRWIKNISDLHRSKPPPQVHYSKSMPDIESLMQIWPEQLEELVGQMPLPGADLDLTVEQYARVLCAILDIPIYKNVHESLHVLFTLFLEFRTNQHFMNFDGQVDNGQPPPFTTGNEAKYVDDYSYRK